MSRTGRSPPARPSSSTKARLTYPHAGRFWQICESQGVTIFYTAPTAIRALMKLGDDVPARYDLTKLRLLGSVGEPINPEAWIWYHENIGRGRCPIVDTWWQTETGAIMISPLPGATATKPGSCTQPLPGIDATIVDARGDEVQGDDAGGYLVIRKPWPSMLRTIWGDNERYLKTYWETFQNRYYVAGDSAHRDKDGYFWIMGRIDDVLNVAGHRLGTMEIESALVAHPKVAEAAVVGKPHDIKGESVFAYVVLRGDRPTGAAIEAFTKMLRDWVTEQLGAIARPDDIRFADNLPKTRSGKILRRLLRAIARNEDITQDLSTLENPAIIDQLRGDEAAPAAAPAKPANAKKTVAAKKEGREEAGEEEGREESPPSKPPKKRREETVRSREESARESPRRSARRRDARRRSARLRAPQEIARVSQRASSPRSAPPRSGRRRRRARTGATPRACSGATSTRRTARRPCREVRRPATRRARAVLNAATSGLIAKITIQPMPRYSATESFGITKTDRGLRDDAEHGQRPRGPEQRPAPGALHRHERERRVGARDQ